jgi:hypothetical protein
MGCRRIKTRQRAIALARRFNEKMIVVVHQTGGVADSGVTFFDVLEGVQKVDPVLVAPENGLSLVTSGSNMINSAGIF